MAPEQTTTLIRDVTDLVAHSDGAREVIETVMRSAFSAMERVAPDARGELRSLVDAFLAGPDDKDIMARLGALLREARLSDH